MTVGQAAFANWTDEQTIYIEGFASEAEADAAWGYTERFPGFGEGWRDNNCNAVRMYWNGSEYQ